MCRAAVPAASVNARNVNDPPDMPKPPGAGPAGDQVGSSRCRRLSFGWWAHGPTSKLPIARRRQPSGPGGGRPGRPRPSTVGRRVATVDVRGGRRSPPRGAVVTGGPTDHRGGCGSPASLEAGLTRRRWPQCHTPRVTSGGRPTPVSRPWGGGRPTKRVMSAWMPHGCCGRRAVGARATRRVPLRTLIGRGSGRLRRGDGMSAEVVGEVTILLRGHARRELDRGRGQHALAVGIDHDVVTQQRRAAHRHDDHCCVRHPGVHGEPHRTLGDRVADHRHGHTERDPTGVEHPSIDQHWTAFGRGRPAPARRDDPGNVTVAVTDWAETGDGRRSGPERACAVPA